MHVLHQRPLFHVVAGTVGGIWANAIRPAEFKIAGIKLFPAGQNF